MNPFKTLSEYRPKNQGLYGRSTLEPALRAAIDQAVEEKEDVTLYCTLRRGETRTYMPGKRYYWLPSEQTPTNPDFIYVCKIEWRNAS